MLNSHVSDLVCQLHARSNGHVVPILALQIVRKMCWRASRGSYREMANFDSIHVVVFL